MKLTIYTSIHQLDINAVRKEYIKKYYSRYDFPRSVMDKVFAKAYADTKDMNQVLNRRLYAILRAEIRHSMTSYNDQLSLYNEMGTLRTYERIKKKYSIQAQYIIAVNNLRNRPIWYRILKKLI